MQADDKQTLQYPGQGCDARSPLVGHVVRCVDLAERALCLVIQGFADISVGLDAVSLRKPLVNPLRFTDPTCNAISVIDASDLASKLLAARLRPSMW